MLPLVLVVIVLQREVQVVLVASASVVQLKAFFKIELQVDPEIN